MRRPFITCDCLGTQAIDSKALSKVSGQDVRPACSALCTSQLDIAAAAIAEGDAVLCCAQEVRAFEDLAAELGRPSPQFLDLRDRAGWSEDSGSKVPKMSALIADAMLPARPGKTIEISSEGLCLILGREDAALDAAEQLSPYLGVTVLLESGEAPVTRNFDVIRGALRKAAGALGQFEVEIDALQQTQPGGRGDFTLTDPRDSGISNCDIILDLSAGPPLFPAPDKREGYLRADPKHPRAVAAAILAASHLSGTFERPLYVKTESLLCAHSRAGQIGCTRCMDVCPTGAILPDGNHISVSPMICAGCGACSSACPSGAISYDAPPTDFIFLRVQTLARAFMESGGVAPRLLVHDAHGAEMIRLSARHGRGLPADVIPLEMPALGAFGHSEIAAALAAGFANVTMLAGRDVDLAAMEQQIALARAIAGNEAVRVLDTEDPDAIPEHLHEGPAPDSVATPVYPMGTRRQITRQAARALRPDSKYLPLPDGAAYGAVAVNADACTLCLSCASICPSGALSDNPDVPQVRFQEDACLQCGLCASVCPENAISYEPRLNLTDAALAQTVLHEEEPFACIECGSLFGVKSTIDRITERLAEHSMFDGDKIRIIQMCDNCRVNAQYHADDNPFAAGDRPRVRTTDDYLSKRLDQ